MEIVKSGTKVFLSKINEIIEFCNGINIPDISGKADKADTYTKSQVNSFIDKYFECSHIQCNYYCSRNRCRMEFMDIAFWRNMEMLLY